MALARRVGRSVQRWILPLPLARIKGGLRQWRASLLRHPLAEELERTRRDNEQLQKLLEELPEIFERKYQQRLEPLLEHQYRLLEDNALLMDQLRLLQGRSESVQDVRQLVSVEAREGAADPSPDAVSPQEPALTTTETVPPSDEAPIGEVSVHLEGVPVLVDVGSLLLTPPWGVPAPSVIEAIHPADSASAPVAAPAPIGPASAATAEVPTVADRPEPSFEDLVSMASEQLQAHSGSEEPELNPPGAAAPWLAGPDPGPGLAEELDPDVLAAASMAFIRPPVVAPEELADAVPDAPPEAPAPFTASPAPEPWLAASPGVESLIVTPTLSEPVPAGLPGAEGESSAQEPARPPDQDLDPLERARARRLEAWRRARQRG